MSTSAVHAHSPSSSWKQEVNRRLAEHRDRKPSTGQEPQASAAGQANASRRAQEAAARVAARYAKAPSYNEWLADEARAALRAAEAATEAALQAKAAAETVLANIEAAAIAAKPVLEPALVPDSVHSSEPDSAPQFVADPVVASKDASVAEDQHLTVKWAQELPERLSFPSAPPAAKTDDLFEQEWWKLPEVTPSASHSGVTQPSQTESILMAEPAIVEPAQPIAGNLIEFPREIVATRKLRPRLAEAGHTEPESLQLSIFEVDPGSVATVPSADVLEAASTAWSQPAWSSLELDAQPLEEIEMLLAEPEARPEAEAVIEPARLNRRLLSVFVDGSLIVGTLVGFAWFALHSAAALPNLRVLEHTSAVAFGAITAAYIALFYGFAPATPGMWFARIRFATLDGLVPTSGQRRKRLAAMLLSVLPIGLGLAWSLFDDDRLAWHDRLSRTYICNR